MKPNMKKYIDYHRRSAEIGDIDPQNAALKYICDRFELNLEQRYWLAFLFGCTYCAPTVYYIYNEFPDFENVDVDRLQRWWDENKDKCMFQTDRLRIKTTDKFVEAFESYRNMIGNKTQHGFFKSFIQGSNQKDNYDIIFKTASNIKHFGRFSNFIYLELLYELTGLNIQPSQLDVKHAESCRNGLCYAMGYENLIDEKISSEQAKGFEKTFTSICNYVRKRVKGKQPFSAWGVETSLCAYKKHKRNKRWVGYYIDRQADEIKKMEESVTEGVNWKPLWDHRKEYYPKEHLWEVTGNRSSLQEPYA